MNIYKNKKWQYYLIKNKDLLEAGIKNKKDALSHFEKIGRKEGKTIPSSEEIINIFDWKYYINKYPDLIRHGINNENAAMNHYINFGYQEKRQPVSYNDTKSADSSTNHTINKNNVYNIFDNIYKKKLWTYTRLGNNKKICQNESLSGNGSTLIQTVTIRKELPLLFEKYKIKSLLDAPCGDFNWMKEVNMKNINYIGIDIVQLVINDNIKKYQTNTIKFVNLNIMTVDLPEADLIMCRDCLVHFSNEDVFCTLKNFKKSKSKYLLTTTFIDRLNNPKMKTGMWQPLNIFGKPFNFPGPLELLTENCSEENGNYKDKSLGLWDLQTLPI